MSAFKFSLLIILLFLSVADANTQSLSPGDMQDLNQCLQKQVSGTGVPGVVLMVANNKKVIYKKAVGFNSISQNDTLQTDDIFNVASMTKAITSVVVMQLYEQGRITLDDPATKYLPEIADLEVIDQFNSNDTSFTTIPVSQPITIRHLLTHTSGIGYPFCNDTLAMISRKKDFNPSPEPYLDYPLLHHPGARWTYGMSTDVLGDIIEKVTDTTIDWYYHEKIFKPLGMTNTFFKVPADRYERLANYYNHENDKYTEHPSHGTETPVIKGGTGLYTTAEDYTKFLQMFLNKGRFNDVRILDKSTVEEMTKNQIGDLFVIKQAEAIPELSNSFPLRVGKDKYGLCFVIRTATDYDINQRNPGSYDWAGLYNTYYWIDTLTRLTAVCLMQVLPFYDEACINVLEDFEKRLYRHLNRTDQIAAILRKKTNQPQPHTDKK